MASVNRVTLLGNLCADPEIKQAGSQSVCNLRIATNEVWKDKAGVKQERTEFHRVTVWGQQGENCSKFLTKGRSVYVEGKLQTRSYDDKDGKKCYATDIVAERVQFIGGGEKTNSGGSGGGWGKKSTGSEPGAPDDGPPPPDDDSGVPF